MNEVQRRVIKEAVVATQAEIQRWDWARRMVLGQGNKREQERADSAIRELQKTIESLEEGL